MMIADSYQLLNALVKAGVVPECRRVVIDAEIGEPVKLYVETFGEERMIDVIAAELQPTHVIGRNAYEQIQESL